LYRLEFPFDHFRDARLLAIQLRSRVRVAISHQYLSQNYGSLALAGDDVAGRLEEDLPRLYGPPRVVVDGRSLSWEEFGELLNPYVGWTFHVQLGDDAEIQLADPEAGPLRARPPTAAEDRSAQRAWRKAGGSFHLSSEHCPKRPEWPQG
jgi:hypothetical protein